VSTAISEYSLSEKNSTVCGVCVCVKKTKTNHSKSDPLRSSNTLGDGAGGPSAAPTPSKKLPKPLRSSKTLSGAGGPSPELQHPRRRCGRPKCSSHTL